MSREAIFKAHLHQAAARFMRKQGVPVFEVLGLEDDVTVTGYCPTCWREEHVVKFRYRDTNDRERVWIFDGMFGELIRKLTDDA